MSEDFASLLKGKKNNGNGTEIGLGELTGTRLGPRKRAFQEFAAACELAIEKEWSVEELASYTAALEEGTPKVGKKDKDGVIRVQFFVAKSSRGNYLFLPHADLETLKAEGYEGIWGFSKKRDALAAVDMKSCTGGTKLG